MKLHLTKALRLLSLSLAALLCGSTLLSPLTAVAADAQRELTVNDSETGNGLFQFEFHGSWVHEGGYPSRFEGGDEHWTTTSVFGSSYPGVTFRFAGNRIRLYGHKVPEGAMATVTLDGKDMGVVDFYNPSRIEKTLLFACDGLASGEHTLTLQLIADKNPSAGNTHEASIDYAVVTTTEDVPATGIEASTDAVTLEAGMTYALSYRLLPDYATESPTVTYVSADPSVATVTEDGLITAVSVGKTTVTVAPAGAAYKATVSVTVRAPIGGKLVAMAGSTNEHTRPDAYETLFRGLTGEEDTALSVIAWQNDVASAKFDLLTKGDALTNVTATAGKLTNAHGDVLDGEVSLYFIRNVLAHDSGEYIPDVLYAEGAAELAAASVTSVWVRVATAAEALPGIYEGTVTVTADGQDATVTLPLSVEVIGLQRPENTTVLELWQYPYSSNRYYAGKTTEEYFGDGLTGLYNTHLDPAYEAPLRSQIELYAAAGGNSVTVTIVEDPWNSQTPDPYPSMVKWTLGTDNQFTFDYTDLDYFVELNAACGVDGPIMAFSMADWANRITYYSERTGEVVSETLTPGSGRWKRVWTAFLTDFMAHTKEKGWFDRVYMAMDERPAATVEAVLDLVESVTDENGCCFKTALAVFSFDTEYLFDRVTDLSLAFAMDAGKLTEIAAHRQELGLTTTLYTCGAQNSALKNPPIESVYTLWYAAALGTDGFLRWALDAFNADPLDSSDHRLFAAGDIYLIYPDEREAAEPTAHSSARFEKLAEGCRDISKLHWLMDAAPQYAAELERALAGVRSGDLTTMVTRAQGKLNEVARTVAVEQLVQAAEALEAVEDAALIEAVAAARALLAGEPTEAELTEAAYTLTVALRRLCEEETYPETDGETSPETTAEPAESTESSQDTDTTASTAESATHEGGSDTGCRSAVSGGLAAVAAVGAALAIRRRKKERGE